MEKKIYDGTMDNKEWYKVYWDYFSLMSSQRIQMVNFYITIEVALFGGFFFLLKLDYRMRWAEYAVAIAIVFISITFYGLDRRSKTMIHLCEDLMKSMEELYMDTLPEYRIKKLLPITYINGAADTLFIMTYSKWFALQFIVIGSFGLLCIFSLFLGKI